MANKEESYVQIKARLDEIVEQVKDESLPLDDALSLYEEAIALGSQISSLIEEGIDPASPQAEAADSSEPAGTDVSADDSADSADISEA